MPRTDPGLTQTIRDLIAAGRSQRDIARTLGVHRDTVRQYLDPVWRDKRRAAVARSQARRPTPAATNTRTGAYEPTPGQLGLDVD